MTALPYDLMSETDRKETTDVTMLSVKSPLGDERSKESRRRSSFFDLGMSVKNWFFDRRVEGKPAAPAIEKLGGAPAQQSIRKKTAAFGLQRYIQRTFVGDCIVCVCPRVCVVGRQLSDHKEYPKLTLDWMKPVSDTMARDDVVKLVYERSRNIRKIDPKSYFAAER